MARKSLVAIGIRRNVGRLAQHQLVDVSFIHIDAHPQCSLITDGEDGIRVRGRIRNALARSMILSQNGAIDRRANKRLVEYGACFFPFGPGEFEVRFCHGAVFLTRIGVHQVVVVRHLLETRLGHFVLLRVAALFFA